MSAVGRSLISRRLLIALLVLGLFVLFDLALFGWLIFRTMSEREINEVLLETQGEAEALAQRLVSRSKEEGDLYLAIAREREIQTYMDSVLLERKIVRKVEIRDREGRLIYTRDETFPDAQAGSPEEELLGALEITQPELSTGGDVEVSEETLRQLEVELPTIRAPIGELGTLTIGISEAELEERIAVLRRELVGKASVVAAVTLLLLVTGYVAIWFLLQRARRLEEQAEEAERMAYIGTLASGLAHEIRNPLNSLSLNMQMLKEDIADQTTSTGQRLLDLTRSEISRLERLVTDFLAYAKPRPVELEEIVPEELLERVGALLVGELKRRGVRLEVEDRSGGAVVEADAAQMKQLLLNLAQNALAAMEETERPGRLRLVTYRRGSHVVFEVVDNGRGIPPEEQERIFDLFYSTRKGGTGLGLAIVQRIVKEHDGRLEVESKPGVGTAISVYLPAGPAHGLPAHEPVVAERGGGG